MLATPHANLPNIFVGFSLSILYVFPCGPTSLISVEAPSSTLTRCEMNSHGLAQHSLRRERGHIKAQLHHRKCARLHRMFGTKVCCAPTETFRTGEPGEGVPGLQKPFGVSVGANPPPPLIGRETGLSA